MTSLTERRFAKIEPLLAESLDLLKRGGNGFEIEQKLRDALNMSHREIHDCMLDLLKNETYAPVAAYVLENGALQGFPRSGDAISLAKLYGSPSYYHDASIGQKRIAWFARHEIRYPN